MLAKLKLWIGGVLLAASIVFGAWVAGNSNGKSAAEIERQKQAAESLRKARSIEQKADASPIGDVRARIAGRMRD